MIFKITRFIIAATLFSTALQAKPGDKDLVVARHLPAKSSHHVYNGLIKNKAPGIQPYSYHITLGWVKDVTPQDYAVLKGRFDAIISKYTNVTFTPAEVKKYTVNRLLSRSPLVLTPKTNEEQVFKKINAALYGDLQKFNKSMGRKYSFHQDVVPAIYTPHITLIKSMDIKTYNLNRNDLIGRINPFLKSHPIELLQAANSKAKAPVAKAKPTKKVKASNKPAKKVKLAKKVKSAKKPAKKVKPSKKRKISPKAKKARIKAKKSPASKKVKVKVQKGNKKKQRKK